MTRGLAKRYAALPTAAKLLLILTAAILPIGIALVLFAEAGIRDANDALRGRANDQARAAARGIESLIARNALALRIAANGALATGTSGACDRAMRSLAIAPTVGQHFQLNGATGEQLCSVGSIADAGSMPMVAPGDIRIQIASDRRALLFRVGVAGGTATASLSMNDLRAAALERGGEIKSIMITDGNLQLPVVGVTGGRYRDSDSASEWPIGNGQLKARIQPRLPRISVLERLLLLLPLLMWVMAALVTWFLVTRLLIRPLRILERAVSRVVPGESASLPRRLGPATEIQQLRDAFARGLSRVEQSEHEMAGALDGQRRLVREVHHRVKNNLQVIASLLNIHGRSAETVEARAAYASIGRRVGALSIVHRNHFAEMEENRGIALRPLLAELTAELRAGAPEAARGLHVDLELETVHTTQDVAVSVAFLVTEILEFAMLHRPQDPAEVSLRRTSELTARLTVDSAVLVPDDAGQADKVQFERIIGGLAKQLRSPLDRRLGRYSVDLPVFPAA
jgi:two-component sensor histidine kinase